MKRYLRPLVLITSIIMILVNVLANIIPYNNKLTAEISDSFKVFFVPSGYVFAIWGVIYLALMAYAIYQFKNSNKSIELAAPYVIIGNIANSIWIFAWHYLLIPFTLPLMLILLASLIQTYVILFSASGLKRYLTTLPFGIYLGWISVATIANVTDLLDYIGLKNFLLNGQSWTFLLIIVAGLFGSIFILKYKELSYPSVIIWAVIGIAVKFNNESLIVFGSAITVISLVILMVSQLSKRFKFII